MEKAVELAKQSVVSNQGGPFGAIVVKNGLIVGKGSNQVTSTNDPTAHAEVVAIREACRTLGTFQLDGCEIYTSCEPCPMCLGAIYWARPSKVYFACTKEDAASSGFDDQFIYDEIQIPLPERRIPFVQVGRDSALEAFRLWDQKPDKIEY
jgi:tRNA(Arg) A34 adenosine deaminase TadA